MISRIIILYEYLKVNFIRTISDIKGEYTFNIKGHEIIATFAEKPNQEIFFRIKEILLGDLHIRQSDAPDIKLKKNIKEAV